MKKKNNSEELKETPNLNFLFFLLFFSQLCSFLLAFECRLPRNYEEIGRYCKELTAYSCPYFVKVVPISS